MTQNRKYLIIALGLLTFLALVLFVISKAVAGSQSDLLLWGVVLAGAATFLAALKDIIELVERYWPTADKAATETHQEDASLPATVEPTPIESRTMTQETTDSPYYSCFISYSSKDKDFAQKLHDDLQAAGVECWFAPEDIEIGQKIRNALDTAVIANRKLLLILSQHSTASDWVEGEVETAFQKERDSGQIVLFPIRLDDIVFNLKVGWAAHIQRTRHIGDFKNWQDPASYQKSLQRVLRDLTIKPVDNNG